MRIFSRSYHKIFYSNIYLKSTVHMNFSQSGALNSLQSYNQSRLYYFWDHIIGFFGDHIMETGSYMQIKDRESHCLV